MPDPEVDFGTGETGGAQDSQDQGGQDQTGQGAGQGQTGDDSLHTGSQTPPQTPPGQITGKGGDWLGLVSPETAAVLKEKNLAPENFSEFVQTAINQNSLVGRKGEGVLPKDNDPEGWRKYYREKLGAKDTPDGYDFSGIEIPPAFKDGIDADFMNWYKKTAHDLHLPLPMAQKLLGSYLKYTGEQVALGQQAGQTAINEVKSKLAADYGNLLGNKLELAAAVIDKYTEGSANEVLKAALADPSIGYELTRLAVGMGEAVSDDYLKGGGQSKGGEGKTSKQEAEDRIKKMEDPGTPEFKILMDKDDPKHEALIEERGRLYKIVHGEGSAPQTPF